MLVLELPPLRLGGGAGVDVAVGALDGVTTGLAPEATMLLLPSAKAVFSTSSWWGPW
jgi:hypothetical protein